MVFLKVRIEKYVSFDQPGFVLCTFNDIDGKQWKIIEKIPILTSKGFLEGILPIEGFYIAGEIISEDDNTVCVNTSKPWGIETEDGKTIFSVFRHQISEISSD